MPLPRVTVIPGDVWWLPGHGEAETRDAAECPVMPCTDTHNYPASPQNPCVGGGGGRPVQGQGPSQVILSLDYAVPCLLMPTLAIIVHPGPRGNLPVGTSGGAEAMQRPRALTRRGVWTNPPPVQNVQRKKQQKHRNLIYRPPISGKHAFLASYVIMRIFKKKENHQWVCNCVLFQRV